MDPIQPTDADPATNPDYGQSAQEPHQSSGTDNQTNQDINQPGQGAAYTLPPGYIMDAATGQIYFVVQPGTAPQPGIGPTPTQAPEPEPQTQPPPNAPDYSQVIQSVQAFAEGDATVGDLVKTIYTTTIQDDQFWKGALVGAAATVLLTNESVRESMGKTFASLFGGAAAKESKEPQSTESDKNEST